MNLSNADFGGIIKLHEIAYGVKGKPTFKIPYYQRPYEWDKYHIDNLINDYIKNKNSGTSTEYFVGATVLVTNEKKELEVVDGQQRVTTMYLLNYLRFILSRSLVEFDLQSSAYINQTSKDLGELRKRYVELIGSVHLTDVDTMIGTVEKKIADSTTFFMDGKREEGQDAIISALSEYRKCLGLSEKSSTDVDYLVDSIQQFKNFWNIEELSIKYSRDSFNEKLKEALANIVCPLDSNGAPQFALDETKANDIKGKDEIVGQYVESMFFEYSAIHDLICKSGIAGREITLRMISLIEEMIEKIEFCAVVTGNEKDAYALFESLNDRNKAVDDLDLIKNLYLRAYYNKSGDGPAALESGLTKIDQIWNDSIFNKENRINLSLYGAVYITGDTNIDEKNGLGVRKSIDTYLDQISNYKLDDVCDDIKIYKLIREILNATTKSGFTPNKSLLMAENDTGMSITYKCIYLIRALKYPNVLTGIINVIISTYLNQNPGHIDVADFKNNFLTGLALASKHKDAKYEQINSIAYDLWRVCVLSENYEYPREYAQQLIKNFNKTMYNPADAGLSITLFDKSKKQFNKWLPLWNYGTQAKDIRIKVLLMRLLQSSRDDVKKEIQINSATAIVLTKPENAELDHLEPSDPDTTYADNMFFKPPVGKTRDEIVDGLGNFMILDDYNNIKKSNCPLYHAMAYYDQMLAGKTHWLVEEIKTDISSGSNFAKKSGISIPKEQFFVERRKRLVSYFNAVMTAPNFDTTIVKY